MNNTEISNDNPEKELISDKLNKDDKTKQVNKKNVSQNKKIDSKNDKPDKSFDEISNQIFSDLVSKKESLIKEIKKLETKKIELNKDIELNFKGQSDTIAKRVKGFQEYLTGALQHLSQNVEKLELVSQRIIVKPSPLDEKKQDNIANNVVNVPALSDTFKQDEKIIKD